jgi:hypothetical protein
MMMDPESLDPARPAIESGGPPARIADAEGTMDQAPLVYALVHALDRAITGEMVFRTKAGTAHAVTFFEGAPVRVEPGAMGDLVGEDLVAMDHLREEALLLGLAEAQKSRRRLGELLVRAGAVDPRALTETLTLQTSRRLADLANLPPDTSFSLYFSARAEPEPFAPWAPLDTLIAAIRAWTDRSRLHGTLRWLAGKNLHLSPDANMDGVMLTSREQAAVALMKAGAPSLKALYAEVGKGLSSLLYMLAVTRQFSFSSEKGAPMGRRKASDLVRDAVQVAVPIAPVIAPLPEQAPEPGAEAPEKLSVPPPPPDIGEPSVSAAAPRVAAIAPAPARRRVSVRLDPEEDVPKMVPVRVPAEVKPAPAPKPRTLPTPLPFAAVLPSPPAAPPQAVSKSTPPAARVGYSPGRVVLDQHEQTFYAAEMSEEFRRAEQASRRRDYETADRILRERCTDVDMAEPDYLALSAWVKANLTGDLNTPLNDLTFLLMSHQQCESALYYRGLLLAQTGKDKAALRDLVILVKKNPNHAGALAEIKAIRDAQKK